MPRRLYKGIYLAAIVPALASSQLFANLDGAATSNTKSFTEQLIVSQALSSSCLDAVNSTVTLSYCNANQTSQLWSYNAAAQQLVNKASGQCVSKHKNQLKLFRCNNSDEQNWSLDNDSFSQNRWAFDVNAKNNTVIIYPAHGGSNQRWLVPSQAKSYIKQHNLPAANYPLKLEDSTAIELDVKKDLINRLTPLNQAFPYPRDVSEFPGAVKDSTPRISKTVSIDRHYYEMDIPSIITRKHWTSTGLYAAAGDIINIDVLTDDLAKTDSLFAIINVHTDVLSAGSGNVKKTGEIRRYPNVSSKTLLKPGSNKLRSQYGGQVIIYSASPVNTSIDIAISNVVEAPHFKLGRDSNADWSAIQSKPAPWGVLEGNGVYLDLPKSALEQISDPEALLSTFDQGLDMIHYLAGFDNNTSKGPHQKPTIKERFVDDVQITAGFAHANYPIMTSPGWELHSVEKVQQQGWGNWHELGHNYQQFCLWSRPFGSESTNNIYSLFVQEKLNAQSRIQNEKRYSKAIKKLASNDFDFVKDAGAWDKLVFIMQIKHAFPDLGWDVFRQLNRRFRELNKRQQDLVCATDAASFDITFELLSEITQYDLTQHFKAWKVPVSEQSYAKVASMKLPSPTLDISAINPEPKSGRNVQRIAK
ncbi:M60 family metallopeptidase [Thalassotalea fonticola]|uniref:M60 family metallopeptidase n=1 Tax=Thalassotalea fonticola TaxID=3065649 RepID=A0ABZ0GM12_9GAMM|nr:M60 family metallopeptidase [Colwelliaceae bacterium S1-1]